MVRLGSFTQITNVLRTMPENHVFTTTSPEVLDKEGLLRTLLQNPHAHVPWSVRGQAALCESSTAEAYSGNG
jgi:hypothetical protein